MFNDSKGPITHFEWASFTIDGQVHSPEQGAGKDILLYWEGVRPWSERQGHDLKPKMLISALILKPDLLIIGNGVNGALKVGKKARQAVIDAGIPELLVLKTPAACEEYNRQFHKHVGVVLLAHGTC